MLYSAMMAARAHMTEMGNTAYRRGCHNGTCVAGDACATIAIWLDWTREYDRLRDEWTAAGRPE